MIVDRPHWLLICVGLLWLGLTGMSSCEPAWQRSLRIKPPTGSIEKKIRWYRRAFYRLAKEEEKVNDGGDRLRRLLRKWPLLARATYTANQKRLRTRRKEGLDLDGLDRFYLVMNAFMREALPKSRLPRLKLDKPPPRQDDTAPNKGT